MDRIEETVVLLLKEEKKSENSVTFIVSLVVFCKSTPNRRVISIDKFLKNTIAGFDGSIFSSPIFFTVVKRITLNISHIKSHEPLI